MDWSKAKNIIIVMLILTNLFIIFMYGGEYIQKHEEDDSVYEYTMNVLSQHNVSVECEIPEEEERMHSLVVTYDSYDQTIVQSIIDSIRPLPDTERYEEGYGIAADNFVARCGYKTEGTRRVAVNETPENVEVIYKNYYEDIPLEVCYMKVIFSEGKISGFDRKWMEVEEEGSARMEIMSPLSALLYYMSETEPAAGTVIEDMYMTYWIDSYDISGNVLYDTALPAWCIEYDGGQTQYISATVQ